MRQGQEERGANKLLEPGIPERGPGSNYAAYVFDPPISTPNIRACTLQLALLLQLFCTLQYPPTLPDFVLVWAFAHLLSLASHRSKKWGGRWWLCCLFAQGGSRERERMRGLQACTMGEGHSLHCQQLSLGSRWGYMLPRPPPPPWYCGTILLRALEPSSLSRLCLPASVCFPSLERPR